MGYEPRLEPEVGLEVLSDLTDESLEGQLPDQQLGRLDQKPEGGHVQLVRGEMGRVGAILTKWERGDAPSGTS